MEKTEQQETNKQETSKRKKSGVRANYIYNLAYQIFLLIIPLATTPYVSRILLPEGIGQYSFSMSLITYFTIFSSLGFIYYAQRKIAKTQGDVEKQSKLFWEIVICRLISVVLSLVVNILLCCFLIYGEYNTLMWILSINIINVGLDVSFFFQGNERFKSIVIRNFIIKTLAFASIFIFVKKATDVWVFTLINSLSLVLSSLSMWFPLRKMLVKVRIRELNPFIHFLPAFLLFLPAVATTIYTILDKTLIGVLITDTYTVIGEDGKEIIKYYSDLENGYYEQSEKIVKILMTVITAIGIVMIPRNSNEISLGNYEKVKDNIYKTAKLVFLIGLPLSIGIAVVSNHFVPWFFGEGYEKCSILIKILAPLIVIIGLSNVFGLQYLIPSNRDKEFTISLMVGSLTNVVLNLIFIKIWWSIGAAIATIIAESVVTITMMIMVRKDINILKVLFSSWKYLLAGAIMGIIVYFISPYFSKTLAMTLLLSGVGVFIYFVVLLLLKEQFIFDFINKRIIVKTHHH